MLPGSALLAKVKEMGDAGQSEIVRACGYVSSKKEGGERLNFTALYETLLEAKGVELGGSPKMGQAGRKFTYVATVQGTANLLIGKAHTALLDLAPGDEFKIKLGRKQIRLIPVGTSEDDEE
ncbi:MAG: AbrB-like transcriptional regulator [Synechococcaceae cyanobacterium]|nr:AbrB-like transcriptional regulator [Synechococcaceae cyanobacterium]